MPQAGSQMVKSVLRSRVGLHAADDGLDQDARREVLPGALLALAGGLLQQPLVGRGLDVDVERGPLGLVDQADELLEVDRVVEAGLRLGVDVAEDARALAERAERRRRSGRSGRCRSARAASASRSPSGSSTPRSSAILRKSR